MSFVNKSKLGDIKDDDKLTAKERTFVAEWLSCGDILTAYRAAYSKTRGDADSARRGYDILERPHVIAEIVRQQNLKARNTIIEARDLLLHWSQIVAADASEIVAVRIQCCRHCYGMNHKYQWRHVDEYNAACQKAAQQARKVKDPEPEMPSMEGGFGFNHTLPPVETCPQCCGDGAGTFVKVADTSTLSPAARKLYSGAKQTKDGVQVILRDKSKAEENIAKVLGLFDERMDYTKNQQGAALNAINEINDEKTLADIYARFVSNA